MAVAGTEVAQEHNDKAFLELESVFRWRRPGGHGVENVGRIAHRVSVFVLDVIGAEICTVWSRFHVAGDPVGLFERSIFCREYNALSKP